jgi:hypothetical protein
LSSLLRLGGVPNGIEAGGGTASAHTPQDLMNMLDRNRPIQEGYRTLFTQTREDFFCRQARVVERADTRGNGAPNT